MFAWFVRIFASRNLICMADTGKKIMLKRLATVFSGVYVPVFPDGDVVYLQAKDCVDGVRADVAMRTLSCSKTDKNLLQKGDVLFAAKGNSFFCVVYDEEIKAVASTSFFVIRLKSVEVSPEYLCWYLRQPSVEVYFKTYQAGSTTPLIHKSVLENLDIPLIPAGQQRLIVEISRLAQKEKELQESIIKCKQAILQQLLMDSIK